jgi:hypothetical protein
MLACSGPAAADSLARDPVNGTTLLFPYFEVDLDDPDGSTTALSIRNASATAVLGQVTLWSDVGIALLSFPIYFTGYDVVNIDLRQIVADGALPVTASAGQDPGDAISPQGPLSQDINFGSCTGNLPYSNPVLLPETVLFLQNSLTGQPDSSGLCNGFDHGDRVARGYVTVDTAVFCTRMRPGEPGYFAPSGLGVVSDQNVLGGEYLLRGEDGLRRHIGNAAALEASSVNHATPGRYTFYGRLTDWTAADRREPLNGSWGLDTQSAGTELIVWRDMKTNVAPFNCAAQVPAPLPLGQASVLHFNTATGDTSGTNPAAVPLATQIVRLGGPDLEGPDGKPGWSLLDLNTIIAGNSNPPVDPSAAQALVEVLASPERAAQGGGGAVALPLDTANPQP